MSKRKSYTATANTSECFSICVGRKVVGVLFDTLPVSNSNLARGNKTLVFADGYGLTISNTGTYWTETKDDIARAIRRKRDELGRNQREIEQVLALASAKAFT